MIKYEEHDGKVRLELAGTPIDITASALLMIRSIHKAFANKGKGIAGCFKSAVIGEIEKCFEDEDEKPEDDDIEETLTNLINTLNELKGLLDDNGEHLKS